MAKKAKPKTAAASSSRAAARTSAAQKRRNQNMTLIVIGAIMLALIIAVVAVNIRSQAAVAGEESFNTQGNVHINPGAVSPLEYNSIPPTSGPHYNNLAAWDIYDEPMRYEQVVHNMEDGGVLIYYQCEDGCSEIVEELTEIVQPYIDANLRVLMMPNDPSFVVGNSQPLHKDMGSRIALTAWTKLLKMNEVDASLIRTFIDRYQGIDHHVRP